MFVNGKCQTQPHLYLRIGFN
ncbi:hypothetical protein Goarm_009295 [Gossypium armourianum]|uniref:Uncharacterized protein n=1 Tax=Gossypium armourianum TaxID=34283 RepID=A0A7J9JSH9_9ROSI|nr:hypothetical protein [Gossypium armourianum]